MLINQEKSIIPACDVTHLGYYRTLIEQTHDLDCVGGYKIGFGMGLEYGLSRVVGVTREFTDKPVIYDHQKAGTDIPETGKIFAEVLARAKVDSVILFPQAGPKTAEAWIKACQDQDLHVIVGIVMTHENYMHDQGGHIYRERALEIFEKSAQWGVKDFVIPGNKRDYQSHICLTRLKDYPATFYAPGGNERSPHINHYIIGRKIYNGEGNYRTNTIACQYELL